jgi:hypothetical protein
MGLNSMSYSNFLFYSSAFFDDVENPNFKRRTINMTILTMPSIPNSLKLIAQGYKKDNLDIK